MSERERYHEEARGWAVDRQAREARGRRAAWIVAGIAVAVALFEAVALALLAPLRTVQPITLLVDRQTGFVQALDPLQPRRIGADAALTESLLAQYVAAREGFDRATIAADYRRVALWSAGGARTQYLAMMPASNPQSPLARVPAGTVVTALVKSVSPIATGVTLVRFDIGRLDRGGRASPPQPWIAVVRYRYSDAGMRFEDRLVNPLGFQVTSYRRDPEAPPPMAVPTTPARQAGASSPASVAIVAPGPFRTLAPNGTDTAGAGRRTLSLGQAPVGTPFTRRHTPEGGAQPGGQP